MKKVTLILNDGFDDIISVTAIGLTEQNGINGINVNTTIFQIEGDNDVVELPPTDCNLTKGKIIK